MAFNVLIVDDSMSIRQIIKRVLDISGFDVGTMFEADNGREALDLLEGNWIDVVISDIHMPVMNGIALLEQIKSDELLKSIPVIMVTTEARPTVVEEVRRMGAAGYIKKPFRPEEIRNLLQAVLGVEDVHEGEGESDECDF
ncbi:MAG: response regulator [Deltaproteobacteria bacterium]|nr:response regulator [Candidatus Anaeroferrophillacea bacterium]